MPTQIVKLSIVVKNNAQNQIKFVYSLFQKH